MVCLYFHKLNKGSKCENYIIDCSEFPPSSISKNFSLSLPLTAESEAKFRSTVVSYYTILPFINTD